MPLPARVSGVHGDEDPEAGLDDDVTAHKRDARVVSLQGLLDSHDLLAHHGQHLRQGGGGGRCCGVLSSSHLSSMWQRHSSRRLARPSVRA